MLLLTPEDIIRIHEVILRKIGGSDGLRDAGALAMCAGRPFAAFGGNEMYPGIFMKAAAVLESIARNHPFVDGNKRTAFMTALYIIENNGYQTFFDQKDIEESIVRFIVEKTPLENIAAWVSDMSVPSLEHNSKNE